MFFDCASLEFVFSDTEQRNFVQTQLIKIQPNILDFWMGKDSGN